jgi:hypothetical protein
MMSKKSALLSICAALVWSLFVSGVAHAVQTEIRQDTPRLLVAKLNGTANMATVQLSNTPNPCHVSGKGRTRAICGKQSQPGSRERVADLTQYASAIFTVTLTIMLSTMIFMAAFSLALIVLAALSRRTPRQPLKKARNNLSMHGQEQRASHELAVPLYESALATWPRRAWLVGFVWFIGFLGSIWFLWIADPFGFFRFSNQTN